MATVKKQKGIVLLSKEKLDCFIAGNTQVVSLAFPPNVIRSMEVVDKNALSALIKSFAETNKLPPSDITIIVHENMLFEKIITPVSVPVTKTPAPPQPAPTSPAALPQAPQTPVVLKDTKATPKQHLDEEAEAIQAFIDTVPFDEVLSKTGKMTAGKTLFVVNKSFIMLLKEAFELVACYIDTVYPASIFGREAGLQASLTTASATAILPKLDSMKAYNMLIEEKPVEVATAGPVSLGMGMPQKSSEKKRLVLMVGIFGVLIVALVFVFMFMNAENAKLDEEARQTALRAKAERLAKTKPTPIPSVTATPVASTSAAVKLVLPIEITISSSRASVSAELQSDIRAAGYQAIIVEQGRINARPLITFSQDIPEDVQTELYTILSLYEESTAVQQNTEAGSRVIITF